MKKLNEVRKTRATKARLLRNFEADMAANHSKGKKASKKRSQSPSASKLNPSSSKKTRKVVTTKK